MDKTADFRGGCGSRGGASTSAGFMKTGRSLVARLVDLRSTPTSASWWIKLLTGRAGFLPGGFETEEVGECEDLKPDIDTGFFSRLGLIKAPSR
jgi:hypothetical protein